MKTRRSGLGLSRSGHREAANYYSLYLADSVRMAKREIKNGNCVVALEQLVNAAKGAGSLHIHHASASSGAGKRVLRTARQSSAMQRTLNKLQAEYWNKCVRR